MVFFFGGGLSSTQDGNSVLHYLAAGGEKLLSEHRKCLWSASFLLDFCYQNAIWEREKIEAFSFVYTSLCGKKIQRFFSGLLKQESMFVSGQKKKFFPQVYWVICNNAKPSCVYKVAFNFQCLQTKG